MGRVTRVVELLAVPTLALVAAVAIAPSRLALEVHVWLIVVLAIALLALTGLVRAAYPRTASPFEASLRTPASPPERPASLARLEREVTIAGSNAFDAHTRLRPLVTELATELLASRRGIDLGRSPERARATVGEDVWELVRPDRPVPANRHAPGVDAATLERVVTSLEAL